MSSAKLSGGGDLTSRSESLALQVSNHPASVGSSGLYRHENPVVLSLLLQPTLNSMRSLSNHDGMPPQVDYADNPD